ncbi:squamosa promoter-binding-like protein 9 isoform X2 [Lathyrus oleraceus]|uniref:SBP-type domain-containing protein n=1 Tax=Pisum sativum TaxID=3888 RepID=A0A9D4W6Q6_PEA|nr:squamosa promoter-binding-like protein 9 isoform X2 [Pisum sativum]KAI5396371.1 hypothetical protein KIW84_062538 [Pisum sativum]
MTSGFVPSPSSPSQPNSSTEFIDGLKFGQKIYFEDTAPQTKPNGRSSSSSSSSMGIMMKKGSHPPRCQVEGCKVDLSGAKAYYSRHKHLHRFHQLPEFDQGKRSCRRRLAGHNERRRKPQPSSVFTSRFPTLSPPTFDNNGKCDNFLMECASYQNNSMLTTRSSELVRGDQTTPFTWQNNSWMPPSEFFQQTTNFDGARHLPTANYNEVTDSSCALSLLSNQTWYSRNTTSPSVEMNNYLLNFNGSSLMTKQSSQGAASFQLPNAAWFLKGVDSRNCLSPEPVPGLGQYSQAMNSDLHGEIDMPQGKRQYYWSL